MLAETCLLRVPSIRCEGCARAISQALSQLPEVKAVQVNWVEKTVLVTADERANWERVRQTLIEIGYAPQP
ncbi:MAG: heavy-metal-associated domain-containing protein [Thermoflexales bacterium]